MNRKMKISKACPFQWALVDTTVMVRSHMTCVQTPCAALLEATETRRWDAKNREKQQGNKSEQPLSCQEIKW